MHAFYAQVCTSTYILDLKSVYCMFISKLNLVGILFISEDSFTSRKHERNEKIIDFKRFGNLVRTYHNLVDTTTIEQ